MLAAIAILLASTLWFFCLHRLYNVRDCTKTHLSILKQMHPRPDRNSYGEYILTFSFLLFTIFLRWLMFAVSIFVFALGTVKIAEILLT